MISIPSEIIYPWN